MKRSSSRINALLRSTVVALLVILMDQSTKAVVIANVDVGERIGFIPGLTLVHIKNRGVAFGLLSGSDFPLVLVTVAVVMLLVVYFLKNVGHPWLWLPVGLVLGGAVGNLVDRLVSGMVTDFIDPVIWPAFNFADAAIVVGVVGLMLDLIGSGKHHAKGP